MYEFYDADVQCPFYKHDFSGGMMLCEGFMDGMFVRIHQNEKAKKRLKETYCDENWKDCPLAKGANAKYD